MQRCTGDRDWRNVGADDEANQMEENGSRRKLDESEFELD